MGKRPHITDKKRKFAAEYCIDLNATQASIRAGYSPKYANRIASQLLHDPEVMAMVHKRMHDVSVKADVTAERVLRELARVGFADLTSMVRVQTIGSAGNNVVRLLPTDSLTQDQRAAIAEISETENGVKLRLHDKTKALELLGKYLALFTDRTELTGAEGGPLVMVRPPEPKP